METPGIAYDNAAREEADREQVLVDHLPYVRYIASRIWERLPHHVLLEDMVHSGVLGLIGAFNKFDHKKNTNFAAYAKHRIRGAILDDLRELDWGPRELRRKARALDEARASLGSRLGHTPTEEEVARELGAELSQFHTLLARLNRLEVLSLSAPLANAEGGSLEEQMAAPDDKSPYELCLGTEMRRQLNRKILALPERERRVMTLYYYEELKMKEIGLLMGLGESRISQIHASALLHLRPRVSPKLGNDEWMKRPA